MGEFNDVVKAVTDWGAKTFGDHRRSKVPGILKHLEEEIEELLEDPDSAEEQADCLMLIFQLSRATGVDLEKAVLDKLEINKRRKWARIPGVGYSKHVEEGRG